MYRTMLMVMAVVTQLSGMAISAELKPLREYVSVSELTLDRDDTELYQDRASGASSRASEKICDDSNDVKNLFYRPPANGSGQAGSRTFARHKSSFRRNRQDSSPKVPVGSTITAPTKFLGTEVGYVFLVLDGAKQECDLLHWTPEAATFTLPRMDLDDELDAAIEITRPEGKVVRSYEITLVQPGLLVHDGSAIANLMRKQVDPAAELTLEPSVEE